MGKSVAKKSTLDKVFDKLRTIQTALIALTILIQANPLLMASAAETSEGRSRDVVNGALSILFLIISVVGVLFIMYGLAKWVMAHSQGDGPAINSAMMFIAAGLGLILTRFILKEMKLAEWIDVELIN